MENVLDILSPEDIERDIFEEKMEEQKIQELLTGEAELLEKGIVGWVVWVCYSWRVDITRHVFWVSTNYKHGHTRSVLGIMNQMPWIKQ